MSNFYILLLAALFFMGQSCASKHSKRNEAAKSIEPDFGDTITPVSMGYMKKKMRDTLSRQVGIDKEYIINSEELVRIYKYSDDTTDMNRMIVLTKSNSEWQGRFVNFVVKDGDKKFWYVPVITQNRVLEPNNGWQRFIDSLNNLNIMALPLTSDSIPDYYSSTGCASVEIDYYTGSTQKSFRYRCPDGEYFNHPEARRIVDLLNLIQANFNASSGIGYSFDTKYKIPKN